MLVFCPRSPQGRITSHGREPLFYHDDVPHLRTREDSGPDFDTEKGRFLILKDNLNIGIYNRCELISINNNLDFDIFVFLIICG